MKQIGELLFEARLLKDIPRSGYHFLGVGNESVAEHSFMITFIAYVMACMETDIDARKLMAMCLLHDLPEARTGDMNYVQKKYVTVHEDRAIADMVKDLPFGESWSQLLDEYNQAQTREAQLAHDADQLSLILDLKAQKDIGHKPPEKWLPGVLDRIQTTTGKMIADQIINTPWDQWWFKLFL